MTEAFAAGERVMVESVVPVVVQEDHAGATVLVLTRAGRPVRVERDRLRRSE
jgi:hypothetical protein